MSKRGRLTHRLPRDPPGTVGIAAQPQRAGERDAGAVAVMHSDGALFTTVKPSQHSRTAAEIIDRFLGRRTTFEQQASGVHLVTVG